MDSNDTRLVEMRRLIRKFFPESEAVVHLDKPMNVNDLVTAMSWATYYADYSCEAIPYLDSPPDLGLRTRGGVWDDDDRWIYKRLLKHTGFSPMGRVVIVPDDSCTFGREPIVCHSRIALDRIREFSLADSGDSSCHQLFDNLSDIIFVFESGEAMVLDHDQRFFWAKSRIRNWKEEEEAVKDR